MKTPPIRHTLTFAYRSSLVGAVLIAVVSAAGLLCGSAGLYGPDPKLAVGVIEAEAGLFVPGFLALDAYTLVVGLPILLTVLWLAYRGSLIGLLLWPGALFYVVGLVSAIPGLNDVAGLFGLSQILWFIWLGSVLLRSKPGVAAEADLKRQNDARRPTWTPKTH